jgi:hypothetical protein
MRSYARILSDHLDTAGIENQVLDLTSSRRFSVALVRTLYRRWGTVVVFDHLQVLPSLVVRSPVVRSPVVRLTHGTRPNLAWSHNRRLLMGACGPRYAAVGLPGRASLELMRDVVPEYPPESLFIAGDLRADHLLSRMKPATPGLLGVFSGWRPGSLLTTAADEMPVDILEAWMTDNGYDRAVVTCHPKVRGTAAWPTLERALLACPRVSLIPGNNWEDEFATCDAYLGDRRTSLFDVLCLTGRPVHEVSYADGRFQIERVPPPCATTEPGWPIGTAADASVDAIRCILGSVGSGVPNWRAPKPLSA